MVLIYAFTGMILRNSWLKIPHKWLFHSAILIVHFPLLTSAFPPPCGHTSPLRIVPGFSSCLKQVTWNPTSRFPPPDAESPQVIPIVPTSTPASSKVCQGCLPFSYSTTNRNLKSSVYVIPFVITASLCLFLKRILISISVVFCLLIDISVPHFSLLYKKTL